MLKIILMMACGILVGRMLRKKPMRWLSPLTTVLIWALLFLLGIEVGGDPHIIHSLDHLGLEAVALSVGGSLGSALLSMGLWRYVKGGRS